MGFTKKQIAIFMKDKFLFKFSINPEYLIKYNQNDEYTFDEIEKIIKSNLEYWESIPNNNFVQKWQGLSNRVNSVRKYLSSIEDLNMNEVDSFIYSRLSSDRWSQTSSGFIYRVSIDSPIDMDAGIAKIKKFVTFFIKKDNNNLAEAIKNFIYLSKYPHEIGSVFSSPYMYKFYPALFLLREQFSNIKENKDDFEANIVDPLSSKLKEISVDSDEQFKQITTFIETKHNEIQKQFDEKSKELKEFQSSIDAWQEKKEVRFNDLEETYKNKLSLEAPEEHWYNRSKEYRRKAKCWTLILIVCAVALVATLTGLVIVIHDYSMDTIREIPFVSKSFILISIISFFVYIIRVLIKIVMSNHHLATEYEQKAALTRFYQALTYAGTEIAKEERVIIIHSLFSKVETGLVKTEHSNDIDAILSVLSKDIKA